MDEEKRLRALQEYNILDSLPEEDYDNLTALASHICETPISLVSLVDENRQWFKSHHGLQVKETPREHSFCAHAVLEPSKILEIPDAREDPRFDNNPLVKEYPHIIYYAGVPLVNKDGHALGSLCVIDHQPRLLSQEQRRALVSLSKQVVNLMELRKNQREMMRSMESLEVKNKQLERFASVAAHDLKSPLQNIEAFADLLKISYQNQLDEDGREILDSLEKSAIQLKDLVDGLLQQSRSDKIISEARREVDFGQLIEDIFNHYKQEKKLHWSCDAPDENILVNKTALQQILHNLIANAIKYNDSDTMVITVSGQILEDEILFSVQDNGRGIPAEEQKAIFEIFHTGGQKDRYGHSGTGIGLATVQQLIQAIGGRIELDSRLGEGSTFYIYLPK